ncbi:MAG TPA: DUF1801 domain-containing protein [Archangium sp.]
MAKARSKTKAKSGSKTSKKALKKKPVAKAAKAKRPAPKKVAAKAKKPAPKKVAAKAKKPAPKKVAAKKPAPAKKVLAPAVNRALAQAEVEGLINRLPPPVQPVVKTLRKLVLEAAPEASELLEDGAPAYFANGVFARIEPNEREVLVRFLKGGQLPSASELPGEGDQRSLSLTDVNQLKESVLRKLVREAVMLNLSQPQAGAQA